MGGGGRPSRGVSASERPEAGCFGELQHPYSPGTSCKHPAIHNSMPGIQIAPRHAPLSDFGTQGGDYL